MKNILLTTLGMVVTWATGSFGAQISDTAMHRLPHSSYVALRGQAELPFEGVWYVRPSSYETVMRLYLIPPPEIAKRQLGRRMQANQRQRLRQGRIDQGRWNLGRVQKACLEYARDHDGIGPASVNDLDEEQSQYVNANLQRSPRWVLRLSADAEKPEGPWLFLVPRAQFQFADEQNRRVAADQREVLAVELRPYVDDGKHWVLYTDNTCLREPVDAQLVNRYQLRIRPVVKESLELSETQRSSLPYTVVSVRSDASTDPFDVVVYNPISGDEQTLTWNLAGARQDKNVLESVREGRRYDWGPYLRTGPSPVLRTWLSSMGKTETVAGARPGNDLTMFSLLGGRAAVEETLQLQDLQDLNPTKRAETATVDVASLRGVEVKAHPYAEMLGGQPGGQLALANVVPPERFFVYVAKPEAILPFLEEGTGFLAAAGAGLTGNRLDYDLTRRYLERLGLTRPWLEAVLRSGLVQDMAVILPDLFLIDGTDMTLAVRLAQPKLLEGLLQLLGVRGLADGHVLTLESPDGRPAYWALRGDILCISSHRDEIERVLQLVEQEGEGSLGRSPEFRYMLTQLPLQLRTRVFAYFSDPFVRRLVGPRVKLAQRRRLQARAEMEALTAQALLARLDGVQQVDSVAELVRMKYLPESFPVEEYSIDNQGVVHSKTYGSLTRLNTLLEISVERVTPLEAQAYKRYVENYSRYWRQFFDPIAVRLDDTPEGSLELTTFILPLIDSSIYNQLREMLMRHEDQRSLVIPQVEPTPVLQFSVNLRDKAWQEIVGKFVRYFQNYGHASPALLDDLGPALHLCLFDADPVIALGSGDVMGAFGGNILQARGNTMMMIPVALSLLTRPCTILVETRDAQLTARYLRQAASASMSWSGRRNNNLQVSFYQVDDRDSWVWTMDIVGVIKLRFGVEVMDRYLVIRNIPWSTQDRVVRIENAPLNGAGLTVWPGACHLQLPGLFASAADQERRSTMASLGRLYPLIISGAADVGSADQRHQQLFGFRPLHPTAGRWVWQNWRLASSVYGSAWRQRQPDYDPDRPFELMRAIERMQLTMQFEDTGLRSKISWKLSKE